MIMRKHPSLTYVTVLYPDIGVLLCKTDLHHCILHENGRMGLTVEMHDLPLVVLQILDTHSRGNHLARGAKVVELTTCQGNDSHTKTGDITIGRCRVCAKCTTKLAIEIVFPTRTTVSQEFNSLVAEEPDANICEVVMIFLKCAECLDRWFLKHLFQD